MENQWSNSRLSSSPCMQSDEAEGGAPTLTSAQTFASYNFDAVNQNFLSTQGYGIDGSLITDDSWIEPSTYAASGALDTGTQYTLGNTHNILTTIDDTNNVRYDDNLNLNSFNIGAPLHPAAKSAWDDHAEIASSATSSGGDYDTLAFAPTAEDVWNHYGPAPLLTGDFNGAIAMDPMLVPMNGVPQQSPFHSLPAVGPVISTVLLPSIPPSTGPVAPVSYAPFPATQSRVACDYPGCAKDFKRRPDMIRHYKQVHDRQGPKLSCPWVGCNRFGANGFARKDKLRDHLRAAHGAML